MDLSPTSSPRRQEAFRLNSSSSIYRDNRHRQSNAAGRGILCSENENITPVRQQIPANTAYSVYTSPGSAQPGQSLVRTYSSPSLLDASPKTKAKTVAAGSSAVTPSPDSIFQSHTNQGSFASIMRGGSSGLTPVANNRMNVSIQRPLAHDRSMSESQPSVGAFRGQNTQISCITLPESNSRYNMILPRQEDPRRMDSVELQPVSPPHMNGHVPLVRRPSDISPTPEQRHEYECSLTSAQDLRNTRSFITPTSSRNLSGPPRAEQQQYLSPSSPGNGLFRPYEPDRDIRLASHGVIRDDDEAESIFHSPTKRRSGQPTSEANDVMDYSFYDDEDELSSIPSIHLARSLPSVGSHSIEDGMRCFSVLPGDDVEIVDEEDDFDLDLSMEEMEDEDAEESNVNDNATDVLKDLSRWACFPGVEAALSHRTEKARSQTSRAKANNANRNAMRRISERSTRRRKPSSSSARYMSPEKEREVFDWLHSLKIDEDNNDFIAEAASSKFLTGKLGSIESVAEVVDELASSSHDGTMEPPPLSQPMLNYAPPPPTMKTETPPSPNPNMSAMLLREEVVEQPPRQIMGRRINQRSRRPKGGTGRKVLRSCSGM